MCVYFVLCATAGKPHPLHLSVMVTVLKHQTFADVKAAVIKCLEIEASPKDVVLFECTSSRISRKLVSVCVRVCVCVCVCVCVRARVCDPFLPFLGR